MNTTTVLLGIASPLLQLWLAALLVRRKVIGIYRFFFAYTLFAVIAETIKLSVYANPRSYFRVYPVTQAIYALLGYLAIAEVFYHVFKNFHQIRWFRFLFPGFGIVALGVSVLIAAVHPPVQASPFLATMLVLEIMVRCLQLGVFFLIFGLANFFDLFWRQYSFGIASGFGVAAFGLLTATIVRFVFGTKYLFVFKFLSPVTYLIAVAIWLIAFLKPLPPDPLRNIRPLLTPEIMDEWAKAFRRASKDIFKLCLE